MPVTEQVPRRGKNDHYAIFFRQQAVGLVLAGRLAAEALHTLIDQAEAT